MTTGKPVKLPSLHVRNFRMLEDFTLEKLGRVNLLVGGNNSGKSTVLEAVRVYAGNAHPDLLSEIAASHDELGLPKTPSDDNTIASDAIIPFQFFFTGRSLEKSAEITIGECNSIESTLKLDYGYIIRGQEVITDDVGESSTKITKRFERIDEYSPEDEQFDAEPVLRVQKYKYTSLIPLTESAFRTSRRYVEEIKKYSYSYVPTQFLSMDEIAADWDKIVLTEYESEIISALNFIDPSVEKIAFVKNEYSLRSIYRTDRRERIIKVKTKDSKALISINSMGDGMMRVLQIAVKIHAARGGFLLIDEFENGLHYSIQEKVWEMVFALAEELDIQVFATTHSWDCIESFAAVSARKEEGEGMLSSLGKSARNSDKNKVVAVSYDKHAMQTITRENIEVR
jgi:AAA15 family ATPase/GTPase